MHRIWQITGVFLWYQHSFNWCDALILNFIILRWQSLAEQHGECVWIPEMYQHESGKCFNDSSVLKTEQKIVSKTARFLTSAIATPTLLMLNRPKHDDEFGCSP